MPGPHLSFKGSNFLHNYKNVFIVTCGALKNIHLNIHIYIYIYIYLNDIKYIFICICIFETVFLSNFRACFGTRSVDWAGLELTEIHLSLPPEC